MIGNPENRPPTHPGEALREDFLPELGLTQEELAARLHISFRRVNEIVNKRRRVTTDTALRLARLFDQTPEFWLNMQQAYDLYEAERGNLAKDLDRIEPLNV